MTLAYTRSGSANAPALVFLHGMAMGQWMWHAQVQHFQDYDCYNLDLPGHGQSSSVPWQSFEQSADQVSQLISHTIGSKPSYLVGMSLGAVVGLHLLLRHPQQVQRALFTGAIADTPPRLITSIQQQIMTLLLPTTFGKQLLARLLQLPADVLPAYQQSIDALSMPDFKRMNRDVASFVAPAGLTSITTPVLFATGEKDVAFNRRSVALLAAQIPGAVGVYAPGCHHGWNGENPALFNAMSRAWMEGLPLPELLIPAVEEALPLAG